VSRWWSKSLSNSRAGVFRSRLVAALALILLGIAFMAAEALEDFEREGWARVRGERLRVVAIHGLVLDAAPEGERR
jgi:hypothetical protein